MGGTLYFIASDVSDGTDRELWRCDGTNATKIDIYAGTGSSYPNELTDVGGTLYFDASDGTETELWKYDGTNTTKIDIYAGTGSSYPHELTDVGGTLYFNASDGTETELWSTTARTPPRSASTPPREVLHLCI